MAVGFRICSQEMVWMRHWGTCTRTPKLLVLRAEKYTTQELVRAASHCKKCQFCL
ncbi:hypothetical protein I79_003594 [Cricetulus griseus]|uniref:Uncharacterized protein n=1 Tax=Cricetulus griseus TaxID=10029 RepID=G3H0D8_CRIGR|nr:hypothetical protein I79_003594 [Cricetulus griseus]